ncbi:MAG: hypothetical protein IT577_15110 [Verrucomicrobiae bacterium]|nr:hypothetical protein [Verrucomicrobiae bacterium]
MKVEYPVERAVSVWIGRFPSEPDFDKAVDDDVAKRLGLSVPLESICEISFETEPVPIRRLIEGFSGWQTFVDAAESAALTLGCEKANAALVCYYLKCSDAPGMWGQLHFLGSFSGQDVQ